MALISKVRDFIASQEKKDIYKYILIYLGIWILLFVLIIWWHNKSINSAKLNYRNINNERKQTKKLLSEYKTVQKKQEELNQILDQTQDFRIIEAYNKIIDSLNLNNFVTEVPEPIEDKSGNYIERKLPINLSGINTKQLVELLSEIQKYKRLFTKELIITKINNKIDVVLVIATLEKTEQE